MSTSHRRFLFILLVILSSNVSPAGKPDAAKHREEQAADRIKVDGPGFKYVISLSVRVTSIEGAEKFGLQPGDSIQIASDTNSSRAVEELTPESFETFLSSSLEGKEVYVVRDARPGDPKKADRLCKLVCTEKRGNRYYPPIQWAFEGKVKVRSVEPGSPAEATGQIRPGQRVLAAGKFPTSLTALEGPEVWFRASEALHGERATPFHVQIEGIPKPIALGHYTKQEVEMLPSPPADYRAEMVLPTLEDDRACNPAVERKLIREVSKLMIENDVAAKTLGSDLFIKFHDRFLNEFDPDHLVFTAADIESFEKYRLTHAQAFSEGSLRFVYHVHDVFLSRLKEREGWTQKALAESIDPARVEPFSVERLKLPYPKDEASAQSLWATKTRREVLSRMAEGATLEEAKALVEQSHRRFVSRISSRCRGRIASNTLNSLGKCLGRYTRHLVPQDAERLQSHIEGEMCGIGVDINVAHERMEISHILEESSAREAGLKTGDEVLALGRSPTEEISVDEYGTDRVEDKFWGKCNEELYVTVRRRGEKEPIQVKLIRRPFASKDVQVTGEMYSVPHGTTRRKIGHITIPSFYSGALGSESASQHVAHLLRTKLKGADVILLDMRGTPGGLLVEGAEVAGIFLGKAAVVQTLSANGERKVLTPERYTQPIFNGALVVLADANTASAGEIVDAAVQDQQRGILVGNLRTWAKAQVQQVLDIDGQKETALGKYKVSNAWYFRATGELPLGKGVSPDFHLPSVPAMSASQHEAMYEMRGPPSLPNAIDKPVGKLTKSKKEWVLKQAEARGKKDPSLQNLRDIETAGQRIDALTANEFSLALLKEEKAQRKALAEQIARDVPQGPDQYKSFEKSAYGRQVIALALDLYKETRSH